MAELSSWNFDGQVDGNLDRLPEREGDFGEVLQREILRLNDSVEGLGKEGLRVSTAIPAHGESVDMNGRDGSNDGLRPVRTIAPVFLLGPPARAADSTASADGPTLQNLSIESNALFQNRLE